MYTYHCLIRAEERYGYTEIQCEDKVRMALERGRFAEDYTGRERKYLKSRESQNAMPRVRENTVFIFGSDGKCITLYPKPAWFGHDKKREYSKKENLNEIYEECPFKESIYLNQFKTVLLN